MTVVRQAIFVRVQSSWNGLLAQSIKIGSVFNQTDRKGDSLQSASHAGSGSGSITHETYRRNGLVDFDDNSEDADDSEGIDVTFGTTGRVFLNFPNRLVGRVWQNKAGRDGSRTADEIRSRSTVSEILSQLSPKLRKRQNYGETES
jgi:hypothetical protein